MDAESGYRWRGDGRAREVECVDYLHGLSVAGGLRVGKDRAQDYIISTGSVRRTRRSVLKLPQESPGSVGKPSLATAEKGRAIYKRIKQLVRDHVLLAPPADE